ncbi:hypothetical protein CPL00345_CDS0072 [Klebsiella phage GlastoCabaret]
MPKSKRRTLGGSLDSEVFPPRGVVFQAIKTSHRKFGGVILTDRVEDGSPEVPKLVLKYGMMIV